MIEERFRLIYLSRGGTDIRQISLSWRKFCLVTFVSAIIIFIVSGFAIGIFTRLYHNYQITSLENDREHLQKELITIKERVSLLSTRLAQVEMTSDALRNVASLSPIDTDTRQVGVGGPSFYGSLDFGYYPDEISRTSVEIKFDLDKLERAVRLEKSSMTEIAAKLRRRKNRVDHFPSIRPILGGRITDCFGFRTDPFTGKIQNHTGVDIPMPRGTRVLATADGIVKIAKIIYTPHRSYGKEVVIDHGYGYETRYAHLSEVLVRRGQKVKRWEPIGEVGDSGKTTGPHLHYEVIYKREQQNPENFIYN